MVEKKYTVNKKTHTLFLGYIFFFVTKEESTFQRKKQLVPNED